MEILGTVHYVFECVLKIDDLTLVTDADAHWHCFMVTYLSGKEDYLLARNYIGVFETAGGVSIKIPFIFRNTGISQLLLARALGAREPFHCVLGCGSASKQPVVSRLCDWRKFS